MSPSQCQSNTVLVFGLLIVPDTHLMPAAFQGLSLYLSEMVYHLQLLGLVPVVPVAASFHRVDTRIGLDIISPNDLPAHT